VNRLHAVVNPGLGGAGAEPQEVDLFVEGASVAEDAVVRGFEVEVAHRGAERADPPKFVEVSQADL
jgi:hypothetical protein